MNEIKEKLNNIVNTYRFLFYVKKKKSETTEIHKKIIPLKTIRYNMENF